MDSGILSTQDEMCPCGCGPRATLHLRGFTVVDEREQALTHIENLLRQAERDAAFLGGRDHDPGLYDEAYRLLDLLRERASL
jgi:hypothetical protein